MLRIGFRFEFVLSKLCNMFEDASCFCSIKRRCLKLMFFFPDLIESIQEKMYVWLVPNVRIVYMCQGLNSHYFHIIGDGHQPNSRGLYTHYKDSYSRWDDHPQYSGFWPWHIWQFHIICSLDGYFRFKSKPSQMATCDKFHGENAGTLGMVPLRINPIYTLYSGYLLGISPIKGLLGGLNG